MANQIRLKRASGSDPSASDLVTGELAVRTDTAKLFTKKDDNSVVEIGGISDGDKGDITVSNSGATFTIDANAITAGKIPNSEITLAKITDIPQNRIAGRISSGSGVIQELTAANVRTIINVADGANVGITDLVSDTSPQLGGDLESNGHDIKIADATGYDGNNIYMGTGADCRIHHDGSNFSIAEATGDVTIQAADDIFLKPQGGENGIKIIGDGAVELYHNNNKKFETTGVGVEITGNARTSIVTVSDASNITIPLNQGTHFVVTLGGNRTFVNTNMQASDATGASGSIFIVQDGTGSRTASFQSTYKFPGGTAPTLSTAANAVDRLDYVVRSTNEVHCVVTLDVK
tara:strand:+ start:97 stop:1140 length:1044 start_codon:yes stop_codon:yes gene_type:complete